MVTKEKLKDLEEESITLEKKAKEVIAEARLFY